MNILVDSFADEDLTNAQMINAREIVSRLDPDKFFVAMFVRGTPAPRIAARPNTRLIQIPQRLQTAPILARFLFGGQNIIFYLKPSPASRWYLKLRRFVPNRAIVVGTVESQTDWKDDTITRQSVRLIEETVLRSDCLFSNSTNVKKSLQTNYGLKSEIVATGVDTEFFTPNWDRPPNTRLRVLFVGALREFKGPRVVLDAAQRYPQADFILIGDGVLEEELRRSAQAMPNVEMRGRLGRSEVRDEFRRADVFMFPSRWEGSPRVLLEAAASGLPIVARKDYEPESVIHRVTGFLASDDEEMMSHLGLLLGDDALRLKFGEAGRAHAKNFSWDVITREWEAIFCRLVKA